MAIVPPFSLYSNQTWGWFREQSASCPVFRCGWLLRTIYIFDFRRRDRLVGSSDSRRSSHCHERRNGRSEPANDHGLRPVFVSGASGGRLHRYCRDEGLQNRAQDQERARREYALDGGHISEVGSATDVVNVEANAEALQVEN